MVLVSRSPGEPRDVSFSNSRFFFVFLIKPSGFVFESSSNYLLIIFLSKIKLRVNRYKTRETPDKPWVTVVLLTKWTLTERIRFK